MHCRRTGTTCVRDIRKIAVGAVNCFFGLLLTGRGLRVTERGLRGTSGLCRVTITGHGVNRVSRDRLVRLGLSTLRVGKGLARTRSNLGTGVFRLHTFLKLDRRRIVRPVLPRSTPSLQVVCRIILRGTRRGGSFTGGVHHHRLRTSCRITTTGKGHHDVGLFTAVNCAKGSRAFSTTCRQLGKGRIIRINVAVPVLS